MKYVWRMLGGLPPGEWTNQILGAWKKKHTNVDNLKNCSIQRWSWRRRLWSQSCLCLRMRTSSITSSCPKTPLKSTKRLARAAAQFSETFFSSPDPWLQLQVSSPPTPPVPIKLPRFAFALRHFLLPQMTFCCRDMYQNCCNLQVQCFFSASEPDWRWQPQQFSHRRSQLPPRSDLVPGVLSSSPPHALPTSVAFTGCSKEKKPKNSRTWWNRCSPIWRSSSSCSENLWTSSKAWKWWIRCIFKTSTFNFKVLLKSCLCHINWPRVTCKQLGVSGAVVAMVKQIIISQKSLALFSGENGSEENCPESSSLSSALCKRSSFIALRRAIYSSTIQVDIMSHASVLCSGGWNRVLFWCLVRLINLFSFSDNNRIQGCHPNTNGGDKLLQLFALSFSGLPFGRTYWPERPLPRLYRAWKLWHCNRLARREVFYGNGNFRFQLVRLSVRQLKDTIQLTLLQQSEYLRRFSLTFCEKVRLSKSLLFSAS